MLFEVQFHNLVYTLLFPACNFISYMDNPLTFSFQFAIDNCGSVDCSVSPCICTMPGGSEELVSLNSCPTTGTAGFLFPNGTCLSGRAYDHLVLLACANTTGLLTVSGLNISDLVGVSGIACTCP